MWNTMFRKCTFWILSLLLVGFLQKQQTHADGLNCAVILDGSDRWEDANEQCMKSNKFDETNIDNLSLNMTLEEYDFDDNCFIRCIYAKVGILTNEDAIDKKQTVNIFKGNMTTEMRDKTIAIWDKCVDEAGKVAKAKNITKCKGLTLHDFCFNKMIVEEGILEMEC